MNSDPDYIIHRLLPEFVRAAAAERGIEVVSYSDDWVHALSRGGETKYVHGHRFDLNASAAGYNANDKVAASSLLESAGVPVVNHRLLDNGTHLQFPVVIKPLHGTGGKNVSYVASATSFDTWKMEMQHGVRWAVSPFEEIEAEFRVIMLDGLPLVVHEKITPLRSPDGMLLHNLGRGAAPSVCENPQVVALARRVMSCLGLRVASVDVVATPSGYKVLEVNDGIMMEHFARQSDEYRQIAQEVYCRIIDAMFDDDNSSHAIL